MGGADHRRARPDHPQSGPAVRCSEARLPSGRSGGPAHRQWRTGGQRSDHAGLPYRQCGPAGRRGGGIGLDSGARRHRPVQPTGEPLSGADSGVPVGQGGGAGDRVRPGARRSDRSFTAGEQYQNDSEPGRKYPGEPALGYQPNHPAAEG